MEEVRNTKEDESVNYILIEEVCNFLGNPGAKKNYIEDDEKLLN